MRFLPVVLLSAFLFAACSAADELKLTSLNQEPCRNESAIDENNQFTGETVEDLAVYQQGAEVYASMDVRSYCNARIKFELERKAETIVLKINNSSQVTDDCLCIMRVTTSISALEEGTYDVMITNSTGNELLAQQSVVVK